MLAERKWRVGAFSIGSDFNVIPAFFVIYRSTRRGSYELGTYVHIIMMFSSSPFYLDAFGQTKETDILHKCTFHYKQFSYKHAVTVFEFTKYK